MSNVNQIVENVAAVVADAEAVFAAITDDLIKAAHKLSLAEAGAALFQELKGIVADVKQWLTDLVPTLDEIQAALALATLLESLVHGIKGLVNTGEQALKDVGLEPVAQVIGPLGKGIGVMDGLLTFGTSVKEHLLPEDQAVEKVLKALAALEGTLGTLSGKLLPASGDGGTSP